jgi:hypothetical protein
MCGPETTACSSPKGVRLSLGNFLTKSGSHKRRPSDQTDKLDEYAMWPRDPQHLFVRKVEYLGETQIDSSRIEISSRYDRPPWKPDNEKQFDVRICAFGPGTSSECYRMETIRTLEEDYGKHVKIYTDRSKMGDIIGYAVVREEHTIKNCASKSGVQCGAVCNY